MNEIHSLHIRTSLGFGTNSEKLASTDQGLKKIYRYARIMSNPSDREERIGRRANNAVIQRPSEEVSATATVSNIAEAASMMDCDDDFCCEDHHQGDTGGNGEPFACGLSNSSFPSSSIDASGKAAAADSAAQDGIESDGGHNNNYKTLDDRGIPTASPLPVTSLTAWMRRLYTGGGRESRAAAEAAQLARPSADS